MGRRASGKRRGSGAGRRGRGEAGSAERAERGAASKDPTPSGGGPRYVDVSEGRDGQRLDNYLMGLLDGVPRSRVYRMVRRGEVRVNGRRAKAGSRLRAGDRVRVPPVRGADAERGAVPPKDLRDRITAAVRYEDEALAVVDKPAGMAVHAGSGVPHGVVEALAAARPDAEWSLAHRLDRATSGCLVLGKRPDATRTLQEAFRHDRVHKVYHALIVGEWEEGPASIDAPLGQGPRVEGRRTAAVDEERGRPARTDVQPEGVYGGHTLLRVEPETGRNHQIRAHLQLVEHPVAGDRLYGDREANRALRELGLRRLFLHASEIRLEHPVHEEPLRVRAPLPDELREVLDRLRET